VPISMITLKSASLCEIAHTARACGTLTIGTGETPEPTMRKAAREVALVAIVIAAIAIATGAARLASQKADPPLITSSNGGRVDLAPSW
jgi:hypothetical protein